MLCYKDRTFCTYTDCKKFNTCDRALTEEVRISAQMWWNRSCPKSNMEVPICIFTDKPECYYSKAVK